MKNQNLRHFFSFLLTPLESGDEEFYKNPLGRKILMVIGLLFSSLGGGIIFIYFKLRLEDPAYLIPSSVFLIVGILCLVIACLGNDRAVAKIWGNR